MPGSRSCYCKDSLQKITTSLQGYPVVNFNLIMFYTYVLKSKNSEDLYIGYTSNLKKRFIEHNQKLNLSTKRFAPWDIIYYEACLSEIDAKRREYYLKTTQGGRMLKIRLKDYYKKSKDLIN